MTSRFSITELNRLRRIAVELRSRGSTLAEVRRATGLSAPTIISASRAYAEGGWGAVDVAKGGRPQRDEVRVSTTDEEVLLSTMLHESNASEPQIWTRNRAALWLANRLSIANSATLHGWVTRMWQRHGLSAPSGLWVARARLREGRCDFSQSYAAFQQDARQQRGVILWLGERSLACATGSSLKSQLYAHTTRGVQLWRAAHSPPNEHDWLQFLRGLDGYIRQPLFLVVSNRHAMLHPPIQEWLLRHPHIHTLHPADADAVSLRPPSSHSWPIRRALPRARISPMTLTHLQHLEAESLHIMREVVAEAEKPVMLYSVGKDSAVMLHLARKAFYPAPPPFPLLHVDTRWKFKAMYELRDRMASESDMELLVHVNPEGIEKDINPFTHGSAIHTDIMKTEGLKQALDKYQFDVAFGGARRDEEKSRAKERIFSFRTISHRWDPKNQRPELWKLYNTKKHGGESIRVFPLSNWTELDVWQYIHLERIPIVPLYLAAERPVVERNGTLIMVDDDRLPLNPGEIPMMKKIRFRTLGCYPLTGAIESEADTLTAIIQEMLLTTTSERQGRVIDKDSSGSMEKKKQEGYF